MTLHEWRDRDDEGVVIYYRATIHASRWEFFSTLKTDPEWNEHEILSMEAMEQFREVLWNKHLRRRAPLKHVEQIDKLIEALREEESSWRGEG